MIRGVTTLLLISLFLEGCGTTRPYSPQDLRQVRSTYVRLRPVWFQFESAYNRGDGVKLKQEFLREQSICRQVDAIDHRDSIDPNTNLFQASATLDNLCNNIEAVYAWWRKVHHLPYDKSITLTYPSVALVGTDKTILNMPGWLKRPAALTL